MKPTEQNLGDFLRNERERKGISLEQLASATKINIRLLAALENDNYVDLPALPFIRGFVISYCRFIGLNSNEVLTHYQTFIEERVSDRPIQDSGHRGYAFEKKESERSKAILWAVMGGFVALGGVMIFVLKPALKHKRVSHIEALRKEYHAPKRDVQPVENKAEAKADEQTDAAKKEQSQNQAELKQVKIVEPKAEVKKINDSEIWPEKFRSAESFRVPSESDELNKGDRLTAKEIRHKLVLKAKEDVYVRYQVDSLPIMTFILKEGRMLVLRANRTIRFQTSNPDALQYRQTGRQLKDFESFESSILKDENRIIMIPTQAMPQDQVLFKGYKALPRVDS